MTNTPIVCRSRCTSSSFCKRLCCCCHWARWFFCNYEEFGWLQFNKRSSHFSPILFCFSCVFWLLRRISLNEHLKYILRSVLWRSRLTPAWFTDFYILSWLCITLLAVIYATTLDNWQGAATWFTLFIICQIVQTNIYHNIWRKVIGKKRLVYYHGRNLLIGLLMFCQVTVQFGLIYWWNRNGFEKEPIDVSHAVYYSFVTGATIGYGDLSPAKCEGSLFIRNVVILQAIVSTTLLAVIIGQAIGALGSLDDYSGRHREKARNP